MLQPTIDFFSQFPHWLGVILMAMFPIGEIRISIPVAVFVYNMPAWKALFYSLLGNGLPTVLILLFAGKFHVWVEKKSGFFGRTWANSLIKLQNKFAKYKKYELWGIFLFIASSLPGTSAYAGALAAFVLGISIKQSWRYVYGGLLVSGVVTTLLSVGVDRLF